MILAWIEVVLGGSFVIVLASLSAVQALPSPSLAVVGIIQGVLYQQAGFMALSRQ